MLFYKSLSSSQEGFKAEPIINAITLTTINSNIMQPG